MTITAHARVDRRTRRITLPLPDAAGHHELTITGTWRDLAEDGPDATAIVVRCEGYKGLTGSFRITEDATLRLPAKTLGVKLEVLDASPVADLRVTVRPADASPVASDGVAPEGTGMPDYVMPPVLRGIFRHG
ncbi:hypothetical protein [Reyranella sp.]|uniref:hypothetical protein n=1 Tax=Reyranella sp. TaxID=1929291 RepID=UPI003D0B8717